MNTLTPLVDDIVARLESPETPASLARDPYWPKWDSPWWWLAMLEEMGEIRRAPRSAIAAYDHALRTFYLPVFPLTIDDLIPGTEGHHVMCHCQIATAVVVLTSWGAPVDARLPGFRAWALRYQLPDGGWNCDEGAYTREVPRSSMVSTAAMLEAMLTLPHHTAEEIDAMDRAAAYMLDRGLYKSISRGGAPMDTDWLHPVFPRFYEYDVLKGLRILLRWAAARGRTLPTEPLADALAALGRWHAHGAKSRPGNLTRGTRLPMPDGSWAHHRPATASPLLVTIRDPARTNPWLLREWHAAQQALARR